MKIPLGLVSRAATENVERFLPSLVQEKTLHLLKSLPKGLRQKLPAAAQIAGQFAGAITDSQKPLPHALSQFIQDQYRITIPLNAWNLEKLPVHLNVLYSVINEKGEEVKNSRDLGQLREELADTVNFGALDKIRPQWEKEDITSWDFGELPEKIPLANQHGLLGYAYPALQYADEAINLRLFSDQRESEANHIRGIAALYGIHFTDKLKQLKKNITLTGLSKLWAAKIGNPKILEQSLLRRIKTDLFGRPWRTQSEFFNHTKIVDAQILPSGQQLLSSIDPVLEAFSETQALLQKLAAKNTGNNPQLAFLKDTSAELQRLVPPDFPELYSVERMKELPRYMKALAMRAERGSLNLASARIKMDSIDVYSRQLQQMMIDTRQDINSNRHTGSACAGSHSGPKPGECRGYPEAIPAKAGNNLKDDPGFTLKGTSLVVLCLPGLTNKDGDIFKEFTEEKINKIEELFWMIEEYKVSLFAQELKTPYPVSPKKLDSLIREIENTL